MTACLAHFGTFDVENYGDLLFPLLLERRLGDVVERFVHVSPAGGEPCWSDCRPTIGIAELLAGKTTFDAAAVGGGHTIHAMPTSLAAYRGSHSAGVAYPALWMVPAYLAQREGLTLWWNAPGVPGSFSPRAAAALRRAVAAADYVAVRDAWSRSCLERAGATTPVEVVPDTGLEVAALWSRNELEAAYVQAFASRGAAVAERSLAFHCNRRYMDTDATALARIIERICELRRATPILLAMGPCHGDSELQAEVGRHLSMPALVIERPASLREITACVALSEGYIGSSLHGLISAISFRRPAIIIVSEERPGFNKSVGLLEQLGLRSQICTTWQDAEQVSAELLTLEEPLLRGALERGLARLDVHWQRVREMLAAPVQRSARGRRATGGRAPVTRLVSEVLAEQVEEALDEVMELRRQVRRFERRVRQAERALQGAAPGSSEEDHREETD